MRLNRSIQKYAILFFVFSINFENADLFNLGVNFLATKLTICLLLLTSILNVRSLYSFKYYKAYLYPIVAYFVLLIMISFFNRTGSTPVFDTALFLNILIFTILINFSRKQPDILLKCLVVFAISTFVLALAALAGLGVTEASAELEGRTAVFGMNHNMLGLNAVISLFIIMSVVFEKRLFKGQNRYLLLLLFPFILNLMVNTGSRVALVSFFLGSATVIFLKKPYITVKKVMLVIGAFFAFVLLWQVYLQNTLVAERLFNTVKEGDLSGRDLIWIPVLDIISNNYVLGVGKTGYARDIASYMYLFTSTPEDVIGVMSPHNVFIEVVCYTGLVGLSVFLIYIYRVASNAVKRCGDLSEYLPIAIMIPIFGLLLSGQIFDQKIVWVLFAYIVSASPAINYKRVNNSSTTSQCNQTAGPKEGMTNLQKECCFIQRLGSMSVNRIKIFIYIDSLRIGGMHRQMLYLAKHLNKEMFEVVVCTQHLTGGLRGEYEQTGCKLVDLGWKRKLDLSIVSNLVKTLENERPDIIFITEAQNLFYYRLARLFWRRKIVQIGSFRAMTFWKGHLKKYYQPLDNLFSRWLLHSSDCVVVNSIAMKNHYSSFTKNKLWNSIEVIYNGSDFDFPVTRSANVIRQELNLAEDDFIVIMVARLDPWKDFETILEAAKIVVNYDAKAKFILLGDGELKSALEQTIFQMNLAGNVLLPGEKKDAFNYINAAEISVLSTHGEGFSNSLMESMALGKPVVATNVGGNAEVLSGAGLLIPPQSPDLFAEAIVTLMKDDIMRGVMGTSGRKKIIHNCSIEKLISSYESLFIRSIENTNGHSNL